MVNRNKKRNGFILLLAILISTVLFSIGVAFSSIVYKELILAFTARESQVSFYAADTGIECIAYWSNKRRDGKMSMSSGFDVFFDDSGRSTPGRIECGGTVIDSITEVISEVEYEFSLDEQNDPDTIYCVHASVENYQQNEEDWRRGRAWGFNDCDTTFPRRVDRAIFDEFSVI